MKKAEDAVVTSSGGRKFSPKPVFSGNNNILDIDEAV